jgi:hypothetical protein
MDSARIPYELPPLILHPFDRRPDRDERGQVTGSDPLIQRHLQARYDEFHMLCLIGKDLNRWLGQCAEVAAGNPELAGLSEPNFIALLLLAPPLPVLQKMSSWGVKNYQIIFSRALGLNTVFPHPPRASDVSEDFLRGVHKYADALYDARLKSEDATVTLEDAFTFEVYASGEYASLLARTWGE